ncbi:hypothetical protein RAS1_31030 [Phycisphaerae bacterium RAS1]|nr:hypothetical protein RAS1_31030 [Phycisphaerae bacterium RAS1]
MKPAVQVATVGLMLISCAALVLSIGGCPPSSPAPGVPDTEQPTDTQNDGRTTTTGDTPNPPRDENDNGVGDANGNENAGGGNANDNTGGGENDNNNTNDNENTAPRVTVIADNPAPDADGRIILSLGMLPSGQAAPQAGSGLITGSGLHVYKIENVQNMPDGSLQVATSPGRLAQFGVAGEFRFTDPPNQARLRKGSATELSASANPQILHVSTSFTESIDLTDDGSAFATVNGSFQLDGEFHLAFDLGLGGLRTFSSSITGDATLTLDASVEAQIGADISRERPVTAPIRTYYSGLIGVPPFVVPIVVEVTSQLFVGIEGDLDAGGSLSTGVNSNAAVAVGAGYDSAQPVSSRWFPIRSQNFEWGYDEPTICFDGNASLRFYVRPHFEVQLYSALGPTFDIEPYARMDASLRGCLGDPSVQYDAALIVGAVGYAKIKADVLDLFVVESPRFEVFVVSRDLRTWRNEPPVQRYTLTLSRSPSNGGSITADPAPTNGTYAAGTVVQLTANPASGYQFSSWSGDASGSGNPTSVTMSGNRSVTATFTVTPPQRYTLTLPRSPSNGGSITADPAPTNGTYAAGTVVQLTANPASGYQFSSWSGDASGSGNPTSVTMSGNRSVTATFTVTPPQRYTLTLPRSPSNGGSITADPAPTNGTYAAGTVVQLTANPASGYQFSSWSGDASGSGNPTSVTMSGNRSVTANFTVTPANDNCANATNAGAGNLSFSGTNVAATTDGSSSCGGSLDVWWRYMPTTSGTATIDTNGSSFDTILSVYAGCGGSQVACDDDGGDSTQSRVQFCVTSGTTYSIRVAGFNGATGTIGLNIDSPSDSPSVIFQEGFEGAFPGPWSVGNNNSNTVAKWGDNRAADYSGSWSAFCADNGDNLRTTYDHNLNTYMQRRNVSLAGYCSATLTFKYWMNIENESSCDFDSFQVNIRSQSGSWSNLLTICGSSSGWQTRTLNLDQYAGQTGLIVGFDFVSDDSVVPDGAAGVWIDDVSLTAR